MGAVNNIPAINIIMDSPCFIPFFDIMNNPTISGIINKIINPSNLNWYEKEVNPIQNSFESNSSKATSLSSTGLIVETNIVVLKRIIPLIVDTMMIFLFLDILERKRK